MTVQQQVVSRIAHMSDEGIELISRIINSMNPDFFVTEDNTKENPKKTNVSKRFGAGKGIIKNTNEFDSFNDEIAEMFEGF